MPGRGYLHDQPLIKAVGTESLMSLLGDNILRMWSELSAGGMELFLCDSPQGKDSQKLTLLSSGLHPIPFLPPILFVSLCHNKSWP